MKKSNLLLAFAVMVFAIGSAFVTSNENPIVKESVNMEAALITGYYPSSPDAPCTIAVQNVACNTFKTQNPLCTGAGQVLSQQNSCSPLYRD